MYNLVLNTFYHGTSKANWELIKKEGQLWGIGESYRFTYLTPEKEIARNFGDVLLKVEYSPKGAPYDNYGFEPPKGMTCWQFAVFNPISIKNVKVIEFNF